MRWKQSDYTGWGRVHQASGELARPERAKGLADLVREDPSPAIGMRRSYGDACLNDKGRAIDMTRLDRVLEFDPETGDIHVEAGAQIGNLLKSFAPRGWLPPAHARNGICNGRWRHSHGRARQEPPRRGIVRSTCHGNHADDAERTESNSA